MFYLLGRASLPHLYLPNAASVPDVIGVCKSVDEATRLTTKSNREVSKRTLHLMDMSGKLVTVTLWGEEVSQHPDEDDGDVFPRRGRIDEAPRSS